MRCTTMGQGPHFPTQNHTFTPETSLKIYQTDRAPTTPITMEPYNTSYATRQLEGK